MRNTILIGGGLLFFLLAALVLEQHSRFDPLETALRGHEVPAEMLDYGAMGRVLRELAVVQAVENDESRFPKSAGQGGEVGASIFQRKRQVSETLYRVTAPGSADAGPRLRISEFMASNVRSLRDRERTRQDWIEIHNPGTTPVDLHEWYLTDDPGFLSKWRFPPRSLAPGGYLIVFASGQDRTEEGRRFHTNFKLAGEGEYLALVRPDGATVAHEYAPRYPAQRADVSYGESAEGARFFPAPTPRAANSRGVTDFTPAPEFSPSRGFYDEPLRVVLATPAATVSIRYTTDGSLPTPTHGKLYREPIEVGRTTTLRATALEEGYGPSLVATHSYLFVEDVPGQPRKPQGFPASWITTEAHYEVDPSVASDPEQRRALLQGLRSVPSLSLVMDTDDLFGRRGIYSHPLKRGLPWERACSLELLHPDGSPGFQTSCGARMHGNETRSPDYKKHPWRLVFKPRYGEAPLRQPLFPGCEADWQSTLILRSSDDSWVYHAPDDNPHAKFVSDQWARVTEQEMGRLAAHGFWAHLYLNGLYWGLYNVIERPDAEFLEAHLGGAAENYDMMRIRLGDIDVVDGGLGAWNSMLSLADQGLQHAANYRRIQREFLDVVEFIDYTLIHFYNGNEDWFPTNSNNLRVGRLRAPGEKFRFFSWDSGSTFASAWVNDQVPYDIFPIVENDAGSPARLFYRLRKSPEFRLLFADRAQRHLFHDGVLSEARSRDRYVAEADAIEQALLAEAARWGGDPQQSARERMEQWRERRSWMLSEWFPKRGEILLEQLRANELYPGVDPPVFSQHGGPLSAGSALSLALPPRTEVNYTTLLPRGAQSRLFVPKETPVAAGWMQPGFDDRSWQPAASNVGYDRSGDYRSLIGTDLGQAMDSRRADAYLRIPFEVDDLSEFDSLRLRVQYDDGFVAYLNGREIAQSNRPSRSRGDSPPAASSGRRDSDAVKWMPFDLSAHRDAFARGTNLLAVQVLNEQPKSSDLLFVATLEAGVTSTEPPSVNAKIYYTRDGTDPRRPGGTVSRSARVYQEPLTLRRSTQLRARTRSGETWSALSEAFFEVPKQIATAAPPQ